MKLSISLRFDDNSGSAHWWVSAVSLGEDQLCTHIWRIWPKLFDFADLPPRLKGVKIRGRRLTISSRSVRTQQSCWGKESWFKKWNLRKPNTKETPVGDDCVASTSESPSLSFGRNSPRNWIRHRALRNDFSHQEIDAWSLLLSSLAYPTRYHDFGQAFWSRDYDCWKR